VIDDERSVCHSCKVILQGEGYEVEYVTSGTEGIERALREDWDVLLLDLKMPDISGMEVLDRIKTERPEMMVIIITGYATIQTGFSIEAMVKLLSYACAGIPRVRRIPAQRPASPGGRPDPC